MQNSEDDSQYNESNGEWILDETRGWYFNSYNTNEEDEEDEEDAEDELVLESNEEPVYKK